VTHHHKAMQAVAAGRAKTYALLSALYLAPPSEELAALIRADGLTWEEDGALGAAADALTACFRRIASEGLSEADIAAEYTRLFVLPFGAVPHESYYLDEKKHLGGHVTVAVQRCYDAAAARLTGASLELPDHMGVELEFMQFLCDLESQFWGAADENGLETCIGIQRDFLDNHLLRWHQALGRKVIADSILDLYRALARLTVDFLEAERAFVPALTQEVCSEGRTACLSES
jgi:TorA maturation chaperone TorD